MTKRSLLALTTLALTLAACGQVPTTPTVPSKQMVNVRLGAAAPTPGRLSTQGLPAGAPLMRLNVTVRDSSNNPVYFIGDTYAPDGQNRSDASSTVILDASNGFGKTLLLPKGTYTFENAGKYEDANTNVLLSYGPAHENQATLDAQNNVVQLRFHGVIDPMKSRLDFALPTSTIYTNDEVHLRLYAQTAEVNGQTFPLPLSDIFMGGHANPTALAMNTGYTLADYSSAEFKGPGSARGVDLIARGTAQNPNLSVTAHFRAYVRQGDSDVAELQPITLPAFEHAIETQAVVADVERPSNVTLNPFPAPTAGQIVTLMGTAWDNNAVTSIEVYEGSTLIATSDGQMGNMVRTDGNGNWQADWTARPGTHELTVVARDAAGNESEASLTVTVTASQQSGDLYFNPNTGNYVDNVVLNPGQTVWIKTDLTDYSNSGLWYFQAYDYNYDGMVNPINLSIHDSLGGNELTVETNWSGDYDWGYRRYIWSNNVNSQLFWVKLTNTGSTPWNYTFAAGPSGL